MLGGNIETFRPQCLSSKNVQSSRQSYKASRSAIYHIMVFECEDYHVCCYQLPFIEHSLRHRYRGVPGSQLCTGELHAECLLGCALRRHTWGSEEATLDRGEADPHQGSWIPLQSCKGNFQEGWLWAVRGRCFQQQGDGSVLSEEGTWLEHVVSTCQVLSACHTLSWVL